MRDEFITLSDAERKVYEAVEDYISTTYDAASAADRNAVGFVMTVYRRRLASSFAALSATLRKRLEGVEEADQLRFEEDISDDESLDDTMDPEEAAKLEAAALSLEEKGEIHRLLAEVRRLPRIDSKARVLAEKLSHLREAGFEKVLVFTQYTDTLDFLREFLVNEQGLEVLCFSGRGGEVRQKSGTWTVVPREEIRRVFRDGSAQVLLCTEAAAEGLNFQFCGALVNYDMPWNPMRVEQRIGRIDRLGQLHETIRIENLHYADTVEADVYRALRARIGLFSKFVGRLQPILAALPRSISDAVLAGRGRGQREGVVENIETRIREQEQGGFDLDSVTDADLDEPVRPPALYDLEVLDGLIRRSELLPPGFTAQPLGPREYKVAMPGMLEPLRVTTSAAFFEDQPGSAELWSPGSPLFPSLEDSASVDEVVKEANRLRQLLASLPAK